MHGSRLAVLLGPLQGAEQPNSGIRLTFSLLGDPHVRDLVRNALSIVADGAPATVLIGKQVALTVNYDALNGKSRIRTDALPLR